MKTKICPRCRRQIAIFLWQGEDHMVLLESPITVKMKDQGDSNTVKIIATMTARRITCEEFYQSRRTK